ncbi:MAG: S9 family peptidase [Alphaproteobacteria bacterium]|nr:S9 family peptidase [Alphaproteobacteria bacterium]MBV9370436.1 S9 family peptidase [Alphaproteobacteria bacterium]MBV9900824.1 S9 family peptidase [Alphaproteobacteria bacterium]
MRKAAAFLLLPLAGCATNAAPHGAAPAHRASIVYPAAERGPVVEEQFGVKVADPYRWLEDDVRESQRVRQWVAEQNALTQSFLATLPSRSAFQQRMRELFSYERFTAPEKKGGRYFYTRNTGLQNQNVLYVRDRLEGAPRLLIDPNGWSADGATALAEWSPSEDGRKLLYSVQEGGTDWRIVRVLDVDTGRLLPDEVKWVKYSNLDWAKDGSGFYYSRFAAPKAGQEYQSTTTGQQVWFHRLGTGQAQDRLVFEQPDRPTLGNTAEVSDDGRWLIVSSSEGTDARYEVTLIDLASPGSAPRRFITGVDNDWRYLGNEGTTFYWVTDRGAPRLRVVATDIDRPVAEAREIVAEDAATLDDASIVGGKLVVSYLVDAKTEVRTYGLDGRPVGKVTLPGIGSAAGFKGDRGDPETFFTFTSFNYPTTVYRYDAATGQATPWAQPRVAFSPADFKVEQRFYRSKDGTRIPLFLVYRKDLDLRRRHPTLLYGYGGFNAAMTPSFSSTNLAWIERGGVYAMANLRGGSEYGSAWHDSGRLAKKQNVFDDFIAAGEYLIGQGITSKKQLAIYGRSNGGLLIGAVVNQRPDLFAAALPAVGVMDMLRFNRFTAGRYWVDDYGYPDREADFRTLLAYSPYHNIRAGVHYPPTLATTADTDDRVVPGHSFKYTAALQNADPNGAPHLIRIETRAGHGSGKPTEKIIEEYADMWAFIAHYTGLEASGGR